MITISIPFKIQIVEIVAMGENLNAGSLKLRGVDFGVVREIHQGSESFVSRQNWTLLLGKSAPRAAIN